MALLLVSLEGSATGEVGSLVGDATTDVGIATLAGALYEIETGSPDNAPGIKAAGRWGIAQRIYIECQTEGQSLTVSLVIDNTVIPVGTVSTPAGIKRVVELAVQRAGWIYGVRITAAAPLAKRIETSSVEMDVYAP